MCRLIKSGEQVSIRLSTQLKVRGKSLILTKVMSALRGKGKS